MNITADKIAILITWEEAEAWYPECSAHWDLKFRDKPGGPPVVDLYLMGTLVLAVPRRGKIKWYWSWEFKTWHPEEMWKPGMKWPTSAK